MVAIIERFHCNVKWWPSMATVPVSDRQCTEMATRTCSFPQDATRTQLNDTTEWNYRTQLNEITGHKVRNQDTTQGTRMPLGHN